MDRLRGIVGDEHVLFDDDVRAGYEVDWTGRWTGRSRAVVRPGTPGEVVEILALCTDELIAVITQGGNTGLVGGGVPRADRDQAEQIVLSMRRFDTVGEVDRNAMQVTVGAGTTIARWREHARRAGLDAGVDFAARDTATVGGAIATNAGGSRVVRFGTMRRQVVGIEAILASGHAVGSLNGLPKETAGIHWPSLITGSEGTLAIVTRARLALVPLFAHTTTAMITTADLDGALATLGRLRSTVSSLDAVEIVMPAALQLVAEHIGVSPPVVVPPSGTVLVIECADHADPSDELFAVLDDSPELIDSAVATETPNRLHLLAFRDRITEAIGAAAATTGAPVFKLDVAVPVDRLEALLAVAEAAAARDGCHLIPFGHLAEGNLHLNHLGASDPNRITDDVLGAVADLDGTISAEHGIGVAKAPWMHLIRDEADLAAQRRLRAALDPMGILNPGVLNA